MSLDSFWILLFVPFLLRHPSYQPSAIKFIQEEKEEEEQERLHHHRQKEVEEEREEFYRHSVWMTSTASAA